MVAKRVKQGGAGVGVKPMAFAIDRERGLHGVSGIAGMGLAEPSTQQEQLRSEGLRPRLRTMITVGILLAAGKSRRFGADKLAALLHGRPLIAYAADAMAGAALDHRLAVGRIVDGFGQVPADGGQADSLRSGVLAAQALGADRVVIALGDMPLVDAILIDAVVAACPVNGASAAFDGLAMPPACFAAAFFPALLALRGDRGAGSLLKDLSPECLVIAAGKLQDVDTQADLVRLGSHF